MEHCKPHKAAYHSTKCDMINDIKLVLTVYRRIYCYRKIYCNIFLMLSNQMLCYKSKCIRIQDFCLISQQENVVGTHWNCLNETVLVSTKQMFPVKKGKKIWLNKIII